MDGEFINICSTSLPSTAFVDKLCDKPKKACLAWTSAAVCRGWDAEASEKCLWNKSALCSMCGCLRDAFETCCFVNWRRNVKVTLLYHISDPDDWTFCCVAAESSQTHTLCPAEAVIQCRKPRTEKMPLTRETRKSATIFTASILKTNLYMRN